MLLTALDMDTGKASLGEPTLWGRRKATKGGVVGCGIGTSLEQHRPDGALSWIRHVTPQGVNR
ncbi:hypothetical protein GCM10009121_04590 [Rhodanobacter soli]